MNNPKKLILRILIPTSVILILLIGLFFVIKKNGITEFDKKTDRTEKIPVELKGTERIPKTAFWIESNGNGNWFNVDWMHNHKNNATISIFDSFGKLIIKGHFFIVCPSDELEFMDDLETQIDFYDGQNIQLKSNCYLMKRK